MKFAQLTRQVHPAPVRAVQALLPVQESRRFASFFRLEILRRVPSSLAFHRSLLAVLLLISALLSSTPAGSQAPSGKDVVAPQAFVSFDPVARGKSFQVAVVLKIRPGFHVNAREVLAEYLIPTDLRADVPAGFKLGDIVYPKGTLQTFTFSKNKQLNVYTDAVVIHMPLTALANAPVGESHLPMKLHYQACSDEICLPPVTLSLSAAIHVTDKPDSARPAHPDIFSR